MERMPYVSVRGYLDGDAVYLDDALDGRALVIVDLDDEVPILIKDCRTGNVHAATATLGECRGHEILEVLLHPREFLQATLANVLRPSVNLRGRGECGCAGVRR